MHTGFTAYFSRLIAFVQVCPEEIDTSCSGDCPPQSTTILRFEVFTRLPFGKCRQGCLHHHHWRQGGLHYHLTGKDACSTIGGRETCATIFRIAIGAIVMAA